MNTTRRKFLTGLGAVAAVPFLPKVPLVEPKQLCKIFCDISTDGVAGDRSVMIRYTLRFVDRPPPVWQGKPLPPGTYDMQIEKIHIIPEPQKAS